MLRNWRTEAPSGRRAVFSLVGANMSFRRDMLVSLGFDESMTFGSEDLDLSMRVREKYGDEALVFEPDARVVHHFRPALSDTLRRSRSYGRGHARMLRKYPDMRPTLFPVPILSALLLLAALRDRRALLAVAALPHLVHPGGLRTALSGQPSALLDAYVAALQESYFLAGAFGPGNGERTRTDHSSTTVPP